MRFITILILAFSLAINCQHSKPVETPPSLLDLKVTRGAEARDIFANQDINAALQWHDRMAVMPAELNTLDPLKLKLQVNSSSQKQIKCFRCLKIGFICRHSNLMYCKINTATG